MKDKFLLFLFCLCMATRAYAQTDWTLVSSTIAGGGTETGTIGQWDASPVTSDEPMLLGGFWNAEELPWVRVQRTGSAVLIAWPASFAGFQVEQASVLGPGATWANVSQAITVANGENQVTVSVTPGTQFFRLRKP